METEDLKEIHYEKKKCRSFSLFQINGYISVHIFQTENNIYICIHLAAVFKNLHENQTATQN